MTEKKKQSLRELVREAKKKGYDTLGIASDPECTRALLKCHLERLLDEAVAKVRARGNKPPWEDHPSIFDLALFVTNELPDLIKKLVEEHLKSCSACKDVLSKIREGFSRASTQKEAVEIVQKLLDSKR